MNSDENKLPKRKNLRLRYFDYSAQGAYFITFCTHNRKNILSHVVGAIHESPAIQLTAYGTIVDKIINNLPIHFILEIAQYVIMPNHIHLIVVITDNDDLRAIRESPLHCRSEISKIIGYIKMNTSKEIHRQYGNITIWQRGFHDRIIRNKREYEKIAEYICENPSRWKSDCFYTE